MKRTLTTHDRILQAAKEMRRNATPAEKALWAALRDRRLAGLKFYRQDVIGPFIADFYCASARLVVEVDRDIHDYQKDQDNARTRQFEDYGYRVIRFRNEEVLNELGTVLSQISVAALSPDPSPDPGGREQLADSPITPRSSLDSKREEPPPPKKLGEGAGGGGP